MKHETSVSITSTALPIPTPYGGFYRESGKRVFDVVLSLALMPIALVLLAVIWVVLRLSGKPVFYTQKRIGRGGKPYKCFKIRTMVPDAEAKLAELCANDPKLAQEWALYQKLADDPRVTRFGAVLRKFSIDELPQIFNVLKGDMSWVGPRPFMACQEGAYQAGGGQAYYLLRPGITGLWQVNERSQTTFLDRVRYDMMYYHRITFLRDILLLLRTVVVVIRRTGC